MTRVIYDVRGGTARYAGRTLAEWVPAVVDRLVERFGPRQVVLFGSVARGDDGPDSDIDLLVVLPELPGRHHDTVVTMLRALRDQPVPVDLVVTDLAELSKRAEIPGTVRVALREGTRYEPGEYCWDDDHWASGVAGNGRPITWEDNDGWRWGPG